MFAEILKIVIADGKGIEVNTSSHPYGLTDSILSEQLLRLYKDLGGGIVTVGSDSHMLAYLGTYIDEAKRLLKCLGFSYFCTYDKMRPVPQCLPE